MEGDCIIIELIGSKEAGVEIIQHVHFDLSMLDTY